MIPKIEIEGVDRTTLVQKESFDFEGVKTSQVDTFSFEYLKYADMTWTPEREDEILVTDTDTSTVVFGGRLVDISMTLERGGIVRYEIKCVDYTHDLNDELWAQTHENQTVKEIIDDLLPVGFTSVNVNCAIVIESIQFNYVRKSDCIKDLAELVGYDWYVDYNKDIHFFAKETEVAPFNITESSVDLIGGTLQVDKSNSSLKNSIYVKGGEYVGLARTESQVADGEQTQFKLANKFSELPVVKVNDVAQSVGIAYLNEIGDTFTCLWSFQEEYIDFGETPLLASDVLSVTGTPLIPLIIRKNDRTSIRDYGTKEYLIEDASLKDVDTAKRRAIAELTAYKDGLSEASFQTYRSGLKAGQTIQMTSTSLGIDEQFIINSVKMKMHGNKTGYFEIELTSSKTVGIIEFLQMLLRAPEKKLAVDQRANLSLLKEVVEERSTAERIRVNPFTTRLVWGPYHPTGDLDNKRMGRWNRGWKWKEVAY